MNSRTRIHLILVCASLSLLLVTCSKKPIGQNIKSAEPEPIDISSYSTWREVTSVPVFVRAEPSTMCVGIDFGTVAGARDSAHRPEKSVIFESELGSKHLSEVGFVRIFVNPIGENAFLNQKNPEFPEGTIIVKVRIEPNFGPAQELPTPNDGAEFLTVMHKLPAGTSPETGDWQYLVYATDAKTELKKHNLPDCKSCHAQWKDTDYISREYLTEDQLAKLK